MKKFRVLGVELLLLGWLFFGPLVDTRAAQITVGPWNPIFGGVELASGQQQAQLVGERNHQVLCLRVDLSDPEVKLFTTPMCTNCGGFETLAENPSNFLDVYDMQVAVNGAFYSSSVGPNDVPMGTPENVRGLAISRGQVVSIADEPGYSATFLFTEDNRAFFVPTNSPPTNTMGIYTAISGSRPLLVNGVNVNSPNPTDLDPRTAFGLSRDRRYLYLLTIDGRQSGWSDGADFYNTGEWLLRFGAADGINVDGGGSTTMVMEDCGGLSQRLNRSSYVASPAARERIIGHNFGVQAPPLASADKRTTVTPGATTATIVWHTDFPGNGRVEFGATTNYGRSTPLEPALTQHHVATLTGLTAGSNYYFRVISEGMAGETFTEKCRLITERNAQTTEAFGMTKSWRYTSNNLDGVNWRSRTYDDSGWMGSGSGLLYVQETRANVAPRNTQLPPASGTIPTTYYFRTRFDFSGSTAGLSLTFSNYLDDGAVFYLNGAEVRRVRMPAAPQVISYATTATGTPCAGTSLSGDAAVICPDVFTISGNLVGNLVQGENVVAVEVHNLTSTDLVFGSALLQNVAVERAPALNLWIEADIVTLYWNGEGFVLQESTELGAPTRWTDVPGPVTTSPFRVTRGASTYYRLRN